MGSDNSDRNNIEIQMSKIILGATIEGISTRMDNTLKIIIGTQEIDKNQVAELFELRNKFIKILLSNSNISEAEEKIIDEEKLKDGRKIKTKSQRLRAVLYVSWQQKFQATDTLSFEDFYKGQMEGIIQRIKDTLE